MLRSEEKESRIYTQSQRASADYIADLLLSLRRTAQRNGLLFLVHLIEMAFYEAHLVARQAEPDMSLIDAMSQSSDTN
jgi:hypothetical protein